MKRSQQIQLLDYSIYYHMVQLNKTNTVQRRQPSPLVIDQFVLSGYTVNRCNNVAASWPGWFKGCLCRKINYADKWEFYHTSSDNALSSPSPANILSQLQWCNGGVTKFLDYPLDHILCIYKSRAIIIVVFYMNQCSQIVLKQVFVHVVNVTTVVTATTTIE